MVDISIADLKKIYSQNATAAQMDIELCYSKRHILVKPLKVKDKKEILKAIEGKNEIAVNGVLDDIISKYVEPVDGGEFNAQELTTQERQQILVYIRVANGEEECKIAHQCPKCEHVNKNLTFKTDSLNLKMYEGSYENEKVVLEKGNTKIIFELGVVTRKDEITGEDYIKKNKLKTMTDKQFAILATVVKNVFIQQGSNEPVTVTFKDVGEKISFIEQLTSNDLKIITDYVEKLDFGVTLPFDFTCSSCEYTSKEEVNVAVFFIS